MPGQVDSILEPVLADTGAHLGNGVSASEDLQTCVRELWHERCDGVDQDVDAVVRGDRPVVDDPEVAVLGARWAWWQEPVIESVEYDHDLPCGHAAREQLGSIGLVDRDHRVRHADRRRLHPPQNAGDRGCTPPPGEATEKQLRRQIVDVEHDSRASEPRDDRCGHQEVRGVVDLDDAKAALAVKPRHTARGQE